MTTREKLKKFLTDNGMFDDQAEQVLSSALPEIALLTPDYKITWDRPSEEYPIQMYAAWSITLKECALRWIDENCPKAWYRPMFV